MASFVRHLPLALTGGEGDGHERGARRVEGDALSVRAAREELGAGDAGELQMLAVEVGEVRLPHGPAARVDEHVVFVAGLAQPPPRAESLGRAGGQRPRARVRGLVDVEPHRALRADVEIEIGEAEGERLSSARPFAVRESVQDAPAQRDGRAREELPILVGPHVALRLARCGLGEEAFGERVVGAEPERKDGHLQEPVHRLPDLAPRRRGGGRGDLPHHLERVLEGERGDLHVPHVRVDVLPQPVSVVLGARLGFDVVGEVAGKLAFRPPLAKLAHGHACGLGRRRHLTACEPLCCCARIVVESALPERHALEGGLHDVD